MWTAYIQKLWVISHCQLENFNGSNIRKSSNSEKKLDLKFGYILKVTLSIPENKHDLFNDYPLCAEKVVVQKENLSRYSKETGEFCKVNLNSKTEKLVPNLNKKNYINSFR